MRFPHLFHHYLDWRCTHCGRVMSYAEWIGGTPTKRASYTKD